MKVVRRLSTEERQRMMANDVRRVRMAPLLPIVRKFTRRLVHLGVK